MSSSEVKSIEKEAFFNENDEYLIYKTNLFEKECFIFYKFKNEKLCEGMMLFKKEVVPGREAAELYEKINTVLQKKYKEKPIIEKNNFDGSTTKVKTEAEREALSELEKLGKSLMRKYESETSIIQCVNTGGIMVTYENKKYHMEQEEKKLLRENKEASLF